MNVTETAALLRSRDRVLLLTHVRPDGDTIGSAAALCRAQQPAEAGERREWLTSFTAVEVSAPLDVKFVQVPDTEAPKIVYDTKGSYTTKFRAEVKDKVLRITERSDARRPDRTSVTVYYNSLERVAIADAVATFDSTLVLSLIHI